jgi:F420-0:gamma-glutamyl ligase
LHVFDENNVVKILLIIKESQELAADGDAVVVSAGVVRAEEEATIAGEEVGASASAHRRGS